MKWLNEPFPTRVLLAFVGGLAVVAIDIYLDNRDHCHEHKMRVAYLGKF
jgi:hypothetical protein